MYSVGMTSSSRIINGVAVHSIGSGRPVVLLHANGGDHRDFDAITDELGRHATVHAIDWPGHGASDPISDPTACGFADLLPSILEQLGQGPFTLIGNSVGGFAAVRTAARRSDLVRAVVLVNPGGFTPRWPTTFLVCRLLGSERVAPVAMRLLPRAYLRRRTSAVEAIRSSAVGASRDLQRVRTFARIWRSFTDREHDARADARSVGPPVLLIWGTRDPILPWLVDGRRARKMLAGSRVVKLPCGHQAFAEMPTQFMTVVNEFLESANEED